MTGTTPHPFAAAARGTETAPAGAWVSSDVPARLDRLAWSPWHRLVVVALGVTWILDGLEASLVAALSPILTRPETLHLTTEQAGTSHSAYLAGQVIGALLFGRWTDRYGRKKFFLVTLAVYLTATALSGTAATFPIFALFRFLAGAGIGGEYSAINSAIDELIPARVRGHVDLAINGSYWLGVAVAGAFSDLLLHALPVSWGWRFVFGLGAVLGVVAEGKSLEQLSGETRAPSGARGTGRAKPAHRGRRTTVPPA